jgi:hypothetical protein
MSLFIVHGATGFFWIAMQTLWVGTSSLPSCFFLALDGMSPANDRLSGWGEGIEIISHAKQRARAVVRGADIRRTVPKCESRACMSSLYRAMISE